MMLRPKYTYNTHGNMLRMLNISDNEKVFVRMEGGTVRYQYDNHLGSACLELDEYGYIISYEEYHPFGTTSYRAGRSATEVSWKRYKYCGKERDEETGLYYYGARYYAAWLCRFVSCDPLKEKYPGISPYVYCADNPIKYIDPDGRRFVVKDKAQQEIVLGYLKEHFGKDIFLFNKKKELIIDKKSFKEAKDGFNAEQTSIAKGFQEIIKNKERTIEAIIYPNENINFSRNPVEVIESPPDPETGIIRTEYKKTYSGRGIAIDKLTVEGIFFYTKGDTQSFVLINQALRQVGTFMAEGGERTIPSESSGFIHESLDHGLYYIRNGKVDPPDRAIDEKIFYHNQALKNIGSKLRTGEDHQ